MALIPLDVRHAAQIAAGTLGRKTGHSFEELLAKTINAFPKPIARREKIHQGHLFKGEPALNLVNYVMHGMGIEQFGELVALSPGTLATTEKGSKSITVNGRMIGKSKSDILLIGRVKKKEILLGVSTKQCNCKTPTNAQLYFTTAKAFCELLTRIDIRVSHDAVAAMRMFCGDKGFRPLDDAAAVRGRKIDPRRWFWEELPQKGKEELERVVSECQDEITRALLQKAYPDDPFPPTYLIHQTKKFSSVASCEVAIYSIDELIALSHRYGGFNKKRYAVRKGSYPDPKGVSHEAPRFGIVQMQRGGQAQHPTQLQFNLEAGYFYKLPQ
jgi:hypothetical protein